MSNATKLIHPIEARVKKFADMAVKAFANHQAKQLRDDGLYRHWKCNAPDTWNMGFHVYTVPGRLIVAGDIGFLAVERMDDMIPWCRGSVRSIDYFAEKVPREIVTREYDADLVRYWIADTLNEAEACDLDLAHRDWLREWQAEGRFESDHAVYEELCDSGVIDGCDMPEFRNYTPSFLWCREAVQWLIARIDEEYSLRVIQDVEGG